MTFSKRVWNALLENEEGKIEDLKNIPKEWQGTTDVDKPVGPGKSSDEFGTEIKSKENKKEFNSINPAEIVKNIDNSLKKYEESNLISEPERDALRHYFGMIEISKKWGTNIAWFLGQINELNILPYGPNSGENTHQELADIHNNNLAIELFESGDFVDFSEDLNEDDIKKILGKIVVPPDKDLPLELQKTNLENEIYNKSERKKIDDADLERHQKSLTDDQKYGPFLDDVLMQEKLIKEEEE